MNERNRSVGELQGKPGQSVGNFVIPVQGSSVLSIVNSELLLVRTKLAYNLEEVESYVRLSQIDSISLAKGRFWWLLWTGIPLIFVFFIGIVFIILFFVLQQHWLAVHSGRTTHILFFVKRDSDRAKQFAQTLLALARQHPPRPAKPATTSPRNAPKLDKSR